MAGKNPYIKPTDCALPVKKYTVTFLLGSEKHVVQVDPARIPYQSAGLPGSLLDIALGNGIEMDHACGGVCACATCHSIVRQGAVSCNEPGEAEEDELEQAPGLTAQSRLGCQCVPDGTVDIVVEIPSWNRNLAREERH